MRAAVLRKRKIEVRETAAPVPGPNQILLKTLSCAICASDLHFMDNPESVDGDESGLWDYREESDIVMGHEFVGAVVRCGPGVDVERFPLGARVTSLPVLKVGDSFRIIGCSPDAPGGFGELMLVQEDLARVVPDGVEVDHAALADAFAVGEYYVRQSEIDDSVVPVVIGAGAIGLSAVVALARRQVSPVIVADYSPERLATARLLGATHTVDPRERSPYELWREIALDGGDIPSVGDVKRQNEVTARCFVYEFVGLPGVLDGVVRDCPPGTHIFTAGGAPEGDHISSAVAKRKGIVIHFGGGPKQQDWYGTLDAIVSGALDPGPAIGKVVDLDGVPDALDLVRSGLGPARIMIHPNGDAW